jgi:aminoglycoside phosphotransferase
MDSILRNRFGVLNSTRDNRAVRGKVDSVNAGVDEGMKNGIRLKSLSSEAAASFSLDAHHERKLADRVVGIPRV